MKKTLFLVSAIIIILSSFSIKKTSEKETVPAFKVTLTKFVCGPSFTSSAKKLHVISSAGTAIYFTNTGLKIYDITNTPNVLIKYYNPNTAPITTDFTTGLLNIIGGHTYRIDFLGASGGAYVGVSQTIIAPNCGPELNPAQKNLDTHL